LKGVGFFFEEETQLNQEKKASFIYYFLTSYSHPYESKFLNIFKLPKSKNKLSA